MAPLFLGKTDRWEEVELREAVQKSGVQSEMLCIRFQKTPMVTISR